MRVEVEGGNLGSLFEGIFGVKPNVAVLYEFTTCCACGTPFAVESALFRDLKRTGRTFHCPNGHHLTYGPGEVEKLKQQLAQEAKQRENLETDLRKANARAERNGKWYHDEREAKARVERKLTATRGVVTRMKNRAANGVCPCCNRYFADLHRHMQSKHPDFATAPAEAEVPQNG
jgi:hypothetical protein